MVMEWQDLRDRYASPYQKMQDQAQGSDNRPNDSGDRPKEALPVLEPAA